MLERSAPPEDAARHLVRRYGYATASCQTTRGDYSLWWTPDGAFGVPYVDTGQAWVAAGEPLCPESQLERTANQFAEAARAQGRRVAFFGVERPWNTDNPLDQNRAWKSVRLGLQPFVEPEQWPSVLRKTRSLREQLRRARARGVTVLEGRLARQSVAPGQREPLDDQLDTLIARWAASKAMPPMGFLVKLQRPRIRSDQRVWVAVYDGRCVGLAVAVPVHARQGWLLEHLIRLPSAPNGTTETLVHTVVQAAAQEKSQWVTLGLAPLAGPLGPVLTFFRTRSSALYDFEGLERFKAKFRPQAWKKVCLCFPASQPVCLAFYDSLCAFAGSGLIHYGVRTLLRGPPVVRRLLAIMLIPWVLAIFACDAEYWFPRPWHKWFWIGFDLFVGGELWALRHRADGRRVVILSWMVLFDATCSLAMAVFFNGPKVQSLLEGVVVVLAVMAPWLCWVVLRGSIVRGTAA